MTLQYHPSVSTHCRTASIVRNIPVLIHAPGSRILLPLDGLWQVTRHDDPDMDAGTNEPVRDLPAQPRWYGIPVPSDPWSLPQLNRAHRLVYRTKVEIPATLTGRSFILDFTGTNWIASIMVNGQFVGARKSTRLPWKCDITAAVQPGQMNEICIGIKSAWYAVDAKAMKSTINEKRTTPRDEQFLKFTKWVAPIWNSSHPGGTVGTGGPARVLLSSIINGILHSLEVLAVLPGRLAGRFLKDAVKQ